MDVTKTQSAANRQRRIAGHGLNVVLVLAAIAAVAALVLEYGFETPPVSRGLLHVAGVVIMTVFILDRGLRLVLAKRKRTHLRENVLDFALIVVVVGALAWSAANGSAGRKVFSAGALYVVITQMYLLVTLLIRGVNVNLQFAGSGVPPTVLLVGSFLLMAVIGSGLLMLPRATPHAADADPLTYPDALFTAISATCVTGLIVKDTGADFTFFGQAVILTLIQLGGLGIMLFGTVLAMMVGKGLTLRTTTALGGMLGSGSTGNLARIAVFVVGITLILELIGALMLFPMFAAPQANTLTPPLDKAIWDSVFHSISAFCNAGFSLYGKNMAAGVGQWDQPLRSHWQLYGVMGPLIILGGLGFQVLRNLLQLARRAVRRHLLRRKVPSPGPRLSTHSKIVLTSTAVLLIAGMLVLLAVEPGANDGRGKVGRHPTMDRSVRAAQDWKAMPGSQRVLHAAFSSVTARTAGFNTVDMSELSAGGKFWICILMSIGGSPGGTAGGIKTVTIALMILTAWSALRRRQDIEVFHRTISRDLLCRAVTVFALYSVLVTAVTLLLCAALPEGFAFIDLLFEACSACGTVGLSTGVSGPQSALTDSAKYVLIGAMFVGRIGPLTLLLALTSRLQKANYSYPTEDVVIG